MNRAFTWVGSKVKESFGAEAGAGYTGGGGVGGAQSYSGFSSEPPRCGRRREGRCGGGRQPSLACRKSVPC